MQVMVRYRVKSDQVEENLKLIRAAYDEMVATQPGGLRYASYQLDDKVSFVDFVQTEERGPGPLPTLPAFQRFRATLDDRCDEPPALTELHQIGSYRFD